jgi:hypothetical protein
VFLLPHTQDRLSHAISCLSKDPNEDVKRLSLETEKLFFRARLRIQITFAALVDGPPNRAVTRGCFLFFLSFFFFFVCFDFMVVYT